MKTVTALFAVLVVPLTAFAQNTPWPASGNVGIGTTSPTSVLEVRSGTNAVITLNRQGAWAGSPAGLQLKTNDAGTDYWTLGMQPDSTNNIYLNRNSVNYVTFRDGGNVGIGTTSPNNKLDVVGGLIRSDTGFVWNNETFSDGASIVNHYGLRWADFSGGTSGPSVMLSGYGGLNFYTAGSRRVTISHVGNVGIGTTSPSEKLSVNGKIRAKEVIVETAGWSDFVLADDYKLPSLADVEAHIKTNKHLPGVPSAQDVAEKGVSVGDMQALLLAKLEEVTLHLIAQEKRLDQATAKIAALEAENAQLKH